MRLKQFPNTLTVTRIFLAIAFPLVPGTYHMMIIMVALATEFLDGFLARTFDWASATGQRLDPLADKLFFLSVCCTWIWIGKMSWSDLALLGTREIGIAGIILFLFISGRMQRATLLKPRPLSKLTTVFQYLAFFSISWWREPISILLLLTSLTGFLASVQYMSLISRQQSDGD